MTRLETLLLVSGLFCSLLLSLVGCGDTPSPAATLPPACPCILSDDFSVDFIPIGGVSYGFGLERNLRYWKNQAFRDFPTGLDQTLCFGGGSRDERTLLHIAGCRDGRPVLRTFRSRAQAKEADVFVGEYELPAQVKLVSLDQRKDGVVFGIDEAGGRILRLRDDDGDGRPDRHDTYAEAKTRFLTEGHDLYARRGGLVVVVEQGCVPGDGVFVVEDRDHDGRPEWFGETSSVYVHAGGPRARYPIQVSDAELPLIVGDGSRVELWESDAQGRRLSSNPSLGLLGSTDPNAEAWDVAVLSRPLRVGMHVCAYDTHYKRWGPPQAVHASFPRVLDHEPKQIDGSIVNEINLAVSGLSDRTHVVLVRGSRREALPYEHIRDDIIRVTVPKLDAGWRGRAKLEVRGPHTPRDALHPRISITVPD